MIDLQAEAMREQYALRLGLPADSHPADVLQALICMTAGDIYLTDLSALTYDMGGRLHLDLVKQ